MSDEPLLTCQRVESGLLATLQADATAACRFAASVSFVPAKRKYVERAKDTWYRKIDYFSCVLRRAVLVEWAVLHAFFRGDKQ